MKIKLEIADTPFKLAQGLMFRHDLAPDSGMLFIFSKSQELSFWGENTFIPLDIAFLDRHGVIKKIAHIDKMSKKSVRSNCNCVMALEVNRGFFKHYDIEAGDHVKIQNDRFAGPLAIFNKNYEGRLKIANEMFHRLAQSEPKKPVLPGVLNDPHSQEIADIQEQLAGMQGQTEYNQQQEREKLQQQQNPNLPEIDPDQISLADDDTSDTDDKNQQPGDMQPPQNEEQLQQQEQDQQLQMEDNKADEAEVPPKKEDFGGNILQAIDSFGSDTGWEMSITYVPKPKERSIGPISASPTLQRVIQAHGHKPARTTHNEIVVSWDKTVNDYRAFISTQIMDWDFTGQKFKKWFRIKP